MTSREIMKAVLAFEHPPRIGLILPDPYPHDTVAGHIANPVEPLEPHSGEVRRWRDMWGRVWASLTDTDMGEVVEPALADWSQLDTYIPPDLGNENLYVQASRNYKDYPDKYRLGCLPGTAFTLSYQLRRLENYLCDVAAEPDHVAQLHRIILAELDKAIDAYAAIGTDAIMAFEDWGLQDRLMVSPDTWRTVYKPMYAHLTERIHAHGMRFFLHSCGKITEIIGDLIDAGVDCLQFDQPRIHGIAYLGNHFGGRCTFWCKIDIQTTYLKGSIEDIYEDAGLMIHSLGNAGGGFIGGCYTDIRSIGATESSRKAACEAFMALGQYSTDRA